MGRIKDWWNRSLESEQQQETRWYNPSIIPQPGVGYGSEASVYVSERSALQHLTVFACVRLLSDNIASLPMDVYRKEKGVQVKLDTPQTIFQPNPHTTGWEHLQQVVTSLALRGNAYEHVLARDKLEYPTVRETVHPDDVQLTRSSKDGLADYRIRSVLVPRADIVHTKRFSLAGSILGLSPIEQARQGIGLSLAAERYGAHWFGDSADPSSVLETDGNLDDVATTRIMKGWISSQGGRRHPAVLSGGLHYRPIAISPNESQFLECVVPGTLVTMADGTRLPVESLAPSDMVLAWNGSKLESARVAHVGAPPMKPLVRIRTARGRELTASADHPVLGLRRLRTPGGRPLAFDGEWIPMGELQVGHHVRVALGTTSSETPSMTADEAYFLGAMTGDGYIRKGCCTWSSAEPAVTARMAAVVASLGGSLVYKDRYDYMLLTGGVGRGGSTIRSLLTEAGLVGKRSHDKHVPESVVEGGPIAWRSFLAGHFDADGSIRDIEGTQKPAAYWASTSRELLDGCQHLLALLGIQSSVYQMGIGGAKTVMGIETTARPGWGLYVMGTSQLKLMAQELDLSHPEKRRRLADFADAKPGRYRQIVFDFDRVTEVECIGSGETVGLEIEGLHTHVTGGIITHNTRQFQRGEIAMMFGIPPHMIGDTDKSTSWGTGIEQQSIGFVKFSLLPWLRCIEEVYSWLILPRGQYMRFNVDGLMRGDMPTRYQSYTQARNAGWLNIDEIRAMEGMDPLPAGKGTDYLQPLNYGIVGEPPPKPTTPPAAIPPAEPSKTPPAIAPTNGKVPAK